MRDARSGAEWSADTLEALATEALALPRSRDEHGEGVVLGEDLSKLYPIVYPGQSDTATFDNCVGKASQGDWTGKCEIRPDGTRVTHGDFKIDNNWGFGDYDALRAIIAAGIGEIARRAKPAGTAANATLVVRRSYEGGLEAALADAGFTPSGELRLLVREVRGRVRAQGLLPAVG